MSDVVELTVGAIAHGGHCVARLPGQPGPVPVELGDPDPGGQVVFVRHALPGERVRAVVTERRRGYLRADAVEILEASPDRVQAPCPYARPGLCGGCDFQHVAPAAQLALKADVVREQLARLGGVHDVPVRVEPLPGGPLGWRSRVQYAVDGSGHVGFRRHRSHDVVAVERCPIAHPAIQDAPVAASSWPPDSTVEVVASSGGDLSVHAGRRGLRLVSGPRLVRERAADREWTVAATGFWQVHPAAPDALVSCVLDFLQPRPGERAWDLYGGAGLFASALAGRVGPTGRVTIVESDRRGVTAARRNLADLPQVRVVAGDVASVLANPRWRAVDLVVLDPPRSGVGREVIGLVVARRPRAVAYVSCDPAAFGRDVATFRERGWRLTRLRAFDAFPMTHHVECVGLLVRATET